MEYQRSFLAARPPIHQAIDLPATHQSSLDFFDPDTPLYQPQPMRVSQKLLQNKIRKLQLEYQQQQEKQNLRLRRLQKEKEIYQFSQRRQAEAQQQRQASLKANRFQINEKLRYEERKKAEKIMRMQTSDAMIDQCRKKVQEKKHEYIIRIQSKTRERQERAHQKRKMIERVTEKVNDQIHLEEWKQYEVNLLKKHPKESLQPDRLYQEHKKENNLLQPFFRNKSKQNRQAVTPQPLKPVSSKSQPQLNSLPRASTSYLILKANKKVQFYGVHQEDMMKQTVKDIPKMRRFIEEHTIASDPLKDKELLVKFQRFLFQEILK